MFHVECGYINISNMGPLGSVWNAVSLECRQMAMGRSGGDLDGVGSRSGAADGNRTA